MGLSEDSTKRLRRAIIEASRGNRHKRRDEYLLDTPEFKKGGKVMYISRLASGGVAGGSKTSAAVTERKVNKTVHDPRNAASLGEIGTDT